jgi:hypothetical protein
MKLPKPPVGPKMTRERLQELTDLTAWDGRKYHDDLPATWDNAEWVSNNLGNTTPDAGFPNGHLQNLALKQAIADVFSKIKNIENDKDGPLWFLAWRMYPNADHPMWKVQEGQEDCGCNCGCFVPR